MVYLFYVAFGGAIGAVLRFSISNFYKIYFPNFPIGTLFINFFGSFLIGILASSLENQGSSTIFVKYFLIIGVLGSFTTFSAFSIETIELFKQAKIIMSINYIILSVTLSIVAAYIGIFYIKL